MGTRSRVLSFMSGLTSNHRDTSPIPTTIQAQPKYDASREEFPRREASRGPPTPTDTSHFNSGGGESPQPRVQRERAQSSSRPMSMVQTYQPPLMDVNQDTLPELQPIFTFLNSHANKLYQEGYFLKLDDQNTHGRPNADRTWTECFAQLVGTVLSLWDAAELDAAGVDGEVLPKFINLTDASIKMIESLPTRSDNEAPLQNVLSISTAGKNRYLLHFNSHHSLIQWTAGIRLAMFEHATLQEAYTGALIAGKGKALNNINVIMDKLKMPTADWARVRFGAGTPWRRCWCVISPPDEKEVQKLQKQLKKKSAYDRSRPPTLKGDIKFFDSKKTKKVRPIATISDAYSAFAIYPQSKPLIDASTLVKVEGSITIHSNPPSTTEGFVFVMPEVHPAVTGFEMMLRWLFPVFDAFALYGRPGRLVAATEDVRSLMFAMPKHRRYGYLEILDVSGLILEQGSATWKESEWRKRMKELTGKRMLAVENGSRANSRYSSKRSTRNSFGPSRTRIHFDDAASIRSQPSVSWGPGQAGDNGPGSLPRTDSAPPTASIFATPPRTKSNPHHRSVSETHDMNRSPNRTPPAYDGAYESGPTPPPHALGVAQASTASGLRYMHELGNTPERLSSEDERPGRNTPVRELQEMQSTTSPEPVAAPPKFAHTPGQMPSTKPYHSPELRRANSRMSSTTLSQLANAGGVAAYGAGSRTDEDQRHHDVGEFYGEGNDQGVVPKANANEFRANSSGANKGVAEPLNRRFSFENSSPVRLPSFETQTGQDLASSQASFHSIENDLPSSQPPQGFTSHSPSPSYGNKPADFHEQATTSATQPSRLQTGPSILRKPLPSRLSSIQASTSPETPSSADSLEQHVIDQSGFEMIGQGVKNARPAPGKDFYRQNSGLSSNYNDDDSTASPDYASTRRSMDTRESMEKYRPDKPRAGVKKTVGNPELGDPRYGPQRTSSPPLHIDFGPTINYARSPSPGPVKSYARSNSPGPAMNNYPVDRAPRGGSPAKRPESTGQSKSPNRKPLPDNSSYRLSTGEPRTLAWQPAPAAAGRTESQHTISPEQFVQQRASATPLYAHQRQQSSNSLGRNTPTPPLVRNRSSDRLAQTSHSRNSSTDRLAQISHSRNNSTDLLQRPNSRGTSAMLSSPSANIPGGLSAQEQERLARVTGQPLINMAMNSNKPLPQGLVGTIDAREKDKQAMKQGMNSVAVQNAIVQRQQQALSQQYSEQFSHDYRTPSSYGNMGQYTQQQPVQGQRGSGFPGSATNAYAQGGGWSNPAAPNFAFQPEQDRQSPSQYSQQQQYFPPQQQGGRGNQGYQQGRGA